MYVYIYIYIKLDDAEILGLRTFRGPLALAE